MRWAHLKAILWLRWRVLMNLVSRRGKFGHVLVAILASLALLFALSNLAGAFVLGVELLPRAEPLHLMLLWAGMTCLLLFGWMVGVMTELQRAESMSFRGLLHLPASLLGVHIYNYIGSFVSLSLFFTLPMMLGVAGASVVAFGPKMLLLFPLIAGFVCMLTALTYQMRGWLGTMMSNKRKRKNVIALITISFVLLIQVPNIINIAVSRSQNFDEIAADEDAEQSSADQASLQQQADVEQATTEQLDPGIEAQLEPLESVVAGTDEWEAEGSEKQQATRRERRAERTKQKLALANAWGTPLCLAVPFGWLAYGARSLASGHYLYAVLCMLGMFGIGVLSLRRSYRTTMAFVTGVGSGAPQPQKQSARSAPKGVSNRPLFVARELPFFGESVSAIGLAGMRNLWRAPEFKMLLMVPVIMVLLGGVMFFTGSAAEVSERFRPAVGLGGIAVGLVAMLQLMQNLFGIDREGFRAFLLCPIPRHQILIGKNLAAAPFVMGSGLLPILGAQFFIPMGAVHLLSTLLLSLAAFLLVSLAANLLSILCPMRFKEGAMQPANAKFKVFVIQVGSMLATPLILLPILVPLCLELSAGFTGLPGGILIYPLSSLIVLLISTALYAIFVRRQGALMQAREQRMLDVLTRAVV